MGTIPSISSDTLITKTTRKLLPEERTENIVNKCTDLLILITKNEELPEKKVTV